MTDSQSSTLIAGQLRNPHAPGTDLAPARSARPVHVSASEEFLAWRLRPDFLVPLQETSRPNCAPYGAESHSLGPDKAAAEAPQPSRKLARAARYPPGSDQCHWRQKR